ncbi:MAG: Dihydrofolate reductase [uncultured Truepera sp.]|uniref:Dihydrofolate reductase n=1 Tax=uncultured Truepera sp. TaxID=543023 RepID=A0A6J4VXC1_9DEIN|nr:MAG: Dihydrofolate reductase [uncultured Truepera sp.]
MRKIVVNTELTLDGVMEAPHTWPQFKSPDVDNFIQAGMGADDGAMLFGRVTYEMFALFWPSQTDYIGEYMNRRTKYVVSSTLEEPAWQNTTVLRGDLAANIQAVKEEPGGDIVVLGSRTLIGSLMQTGLIDEYRLWIHPLVLGGGQHLFPDGLSREFRLVSTHAFSGGIVLLVYRPTEQLERAA